MALTHSLSVRNNLAQVILDALDADVGAGNLELQTSLGAQVANLVLSNPAGVISNGVLTFSSIADDINALGGTVSQFILTDNSGDNVISGSAGISGNDLDLSTISINPGDTVVMIALSYTPAV